MAALKSGPKGQIIPERCLRGSEEPLFHVEIRWTCILDLD